MSLVCTFDGLTTIWFLFFLSTCFPDPPIQTEHWDKPSGLKSKTQKSQPAPLPHTLQAQGSSDGWGKWSPTEVKPCLAKTGSRVSPRPQLVGWSDVFNQAVAAQSPPVPPANEVINTYFVSSAIDSSSSGSGEKNPTLCEQVTEL